ncbi:hypothetical protein DPM19_32390 [Actinomadura craniellae]|uniref:General stress protein 17M-like domain-containing protein n=2 Tax=Actinomadura craniellae TaxID=2231787 RepID=A0A365GWC7_9ACTN|nr:hypothetical protein DPM19_32390 [Actinomadura craniellae]
MGTHVPLASYGSYEEAQRAVDSLSDRRFPVEHTVIVGMDLKLVERVLGRLTMLRAASLGAASGLWFGLLIGLFFAIFTPGLRNSIAVILWGLFWGLVAGALFGLVAHALQRGRRDFLSRSEMVADRYEVRVTPDRLDEARRMLETGPH